VRQMQRPNKVRDYSPGTPARGAKCVAGRQKNALAGPKVRYQRQQEEAPYQRPCIRTYREFLHRMTQSVGRTE